VVTPTNAQGGPADETAVLPRVREEDAARRSGRSGVSDAEVTTELPKPSVPGAADETAVLPAVPPGAADETAVLPAVRADEPGSAGRVPPGYFRDERPTGGPAGDDASDDRTRELPQVDAEGSPGRRRQRSDWAEETPLDDLPTLADELLGPRDDEDGDHGDEDGGRGRRGRRR